MQIKNFIGKGKIEENFYLITIITFFIGVILTLIFQKITFFIIVSDFVKEYLGIITIIISPLIALWVGDVMRRRSEANKQEYELLKDLISYRYARGSQEFLCSLNRIGLVFNRNEKIKRLIKELWRSYVNSENRLVSNQKEVELIHEICKYKNFDISEFDIDNFFVSKNSPVVSPIQIIQQNTLPSQQQNSIPSTANGIGNKVSDTNSVIADSITGGI